VICAILTHIANSFGSNQAACFESREFSLDGGTAEAAISNDLVHVKGFVRPPKEKRQHALLGVAKEGICDKAH
jgi:hypothetical protein